MLSTTAVVALLNVSRIALMPRNSRQFVLPSVTLFTAPADGRDIGARKAGRLRDVTWSSLASHGNA
jgi:hypothetical protein